MRVLLAAAVLVLSSAPVFATDMPQRKPGLWEVTMHMSNHNIPPRVVTFCTDRATEDRLWEYGLTAGKQMCSRTDIQRSGSVLTIDSVCQLGESNLTSHTVMTFDGDSAYRSETKVHYDPPMMGRTDSALTQESRWTGECPGDMAPGDLTGPNGMKMNVKSIGQ